MTKASKRVTTPDRIKELLRQNKKQFALDRQRARGVSDVQTVGSGLGSSSTGSPKGFLRTEGDTMIGPIAFFPKLQEITTDEIDISLPTDEGDTGNYSSNILINAQGVSTTDDLQTITGAQFAGQIMFMQGTVGETISIWNSDNLIPITNPFDLVGDKTILWKFKSTSNKWEQITGDAISSTDFANRQLSNLSTDVDTAINTDVLPGTDVTHNIGSETLAFNIGHFRSIEFEANSTPVGTDAAIGLEAADMYFNVTSGNFHKWLIDAVEEMALTSLGLELPDSNIIKFITSTGADVAVISIENSALKFKINSTTSGNMRVEMLDTTPSLALFGRNTGATLLANSIQFFGRNISDSDSVEYGDIKVRQNTVTTGAEEAEMEFQLIEAGVPNVTYMELNSQFQEVSILKDLSMNSKNIKLIGTGTIGDLTAITDLDTASDELMVLDKSAGTIKKMIPDDLPGGGASDKISEGNSSVEVIDTGTGRVDVELDGVVDWTFTAQRLGIPSGRDGLIDIGSNTLRPGFIYADTFDIQDDLVTNNPASGRTQIEGDQGGMNLGVALSSKAFGFFFGGVEHLSILEDGEINWKASGKQHKIVPQSLSLDIVAESESDNINLITGSGRDNETLRVGDLTASFKNEPPDSVYELYVQNTVAITTGQPAIGAMGFVADNVANNARAYAGMVGAIEDDTTAGRDGRMQLVVANNDGDTAQTIGGLTGIGFDIQSDAGTMKIGFFGVTPVVKQNIVTENLANLYTALKNYGLII